MTFLRSFFSLGVALSSVSLWGGDVLACGGFFCSQSSPVNQARERIVFAQNPDDTVTAIIQIDYAGPAERFAWLLPIAGNPEVGISSTDAIDAISQATEPSYTYETRYEGTCDVYDFADDDGGGDESFGADAGAVEEGGPPVLVLSSGTVGPFDYVVIQPSSEVDDKAQVALDWLDENGYDVTSVGPDVLRPYLDSGLNLIAFRLTKGSDTGSIRPVMITYPSTQPSIPLRPTAVAAQDDMGILVWVLGSQRAVPENYLMLTLNESRIDWFNPSSTYDQLVTEAADEAGGQGFVTEYAGAASVLEQTVFNPRTRSSYEEIEGSDAEGYELIELASFNFRSSEGFRDAIGAAVTLPEGVTLDEFGQNPDYYRDDPALEIDAEAFKLALFEFVVEPLQKSQELFDSRPYLTRLYTTMSANEMFSDPLFTFNPDLPDVSNQHVAELVVHCSLEYYDFDAPWTLVLPSGERVEGVGARRLPDELAEGPATSEVAQGSGEGTTEVLIDNSETISDLIAALPEPPPGQTHDPEGEPSSDDDTGSDDDVTADDDTASDDDVTADDDSNASDDVSSNAAGDAGPGTQTRSVSDSGDDDGCAVHAGGSPSRPWGLALLGLALLLRRRRDAAP
jgi:MYXO-CTERM domain-containing protein